MSDSLFDSVTGCRPTALLKETPTVLLCILQNISEHFFKKKNIFGTTACEIVYLNVGLFFLQSSINALKVGPSPSKKIRVICFIESPLKMIKSFFILKAFLS